MKKPAMMDRKKRVDFLTGNPFFLKTISQSDSYKQNSKKFFENDVSNEKRIKSLLKNLKQRRIHDLSFLIGRNLHLSALLFYPE